MRKECVRKKANLPKIIEEISRTRDISADSNKIIYIRYLNYLGDQQEAFRQLVEDTYLTCRYVFTCRNIDSVDPALNSRCFLIRVPSPCKKHMLSYTNEVLPDVSLFLREKMVHESDGNLNTLIHLMMLHKKIRNRENLDTYGDIHSELAKNIEKGVIYDTCGV